MPVLFSPLLRREPARSSQDDVTMTSPSAAAAVAVIRREDGRGDGARLGWQR